MGTSYELYKDENGTKVEISETSCRLDLNIHDYNDGHHVYVEDLEPEEMIEVLMKGVQASLYWSDMSKEDFVKKYLDKLSFEG